MEGIGEAPGFTSTLALLVDAFREGPVLPDPRDTRAVLAVQPVTKHPPPTTAMLSGTDRPGRGEPVAHDPLTAR